MTFPGTPSDTDAAWMDTFDVTRCHIPADLRHLAPLRERFEQMLREARLASGEVKRWVLAFNEVLTNAIIHGAKNDSAQEVTLEWTIHQNQIVLAVEDPGSGLQTELLKKIQLPPDPYAASGRGLFLLRSIADEIRAFSGSHGFRLELRKRYPHLPSPDYQRSEAYRLGRELMACYESLSIFHRLAQSLQESAELGPFIHDVLNDFIQLHPTLYRVVFVGSPTMPFAVKATLAGEAWFLSFSEASEALRLLAGVDREFTWNSADDLRLIDPSLGELRHSPSGHALPIRAGAIHFGSLLALGKDPSPHLNTHAKGVLRTLADLCGIACVNTHLRQIRDHQQREIGELETAVQIQKSLLPLLLPPESDHWKVWVHQHSSLHIAGDYVMTAVDSQGNLLLAMIDVMGKGLPAAVVASIFRTAFHMTGDHLNSAGMLEAINRQLCRQLGDLGMYLTCSIVRWRPSAFTLDLANAGHCPTLLYSADGARHQYASSGPPLGVIPDAAYTSETIFPQGGERLVFLTDGCYEWTKGDATGSGWEHFLRLIDAHHHSAPEIFWEKLLADIRRQHRNVTPDDCTLLILDIPNR